MPRMTLAKTTKQNSSFLQIHLSGEVVPYHRIIEQFGLEETFKGHLVHVSKEHSKHQISVPSVPCASQWSCKWRQDGLLESPMCWHFCSCQPGSPCGGGFYHQEPQVTCLFSSYSKARELWLPNGLFRQEGMFCGGALPVSRLGWESVTLPAPQEPAHYCLLWKLLPLAALATRLWPDPATRWQLAHFRSVWSR